MLTRRDRHDTAADLAHHIENRLELGAIGETARHRLAVDAAVRNGETGREPRGAREHRFAQCRLDLRDLFGRRRSLVGRVAQHEEPQRGVPDIRREVQTGAAPFDRRQVFGERGEVPRDAGRERCDIHVFDVLERAGDEIVMFWSRRRDREPTVAGHHSGDAVVARRRQPRIPEHLRVVMGVNVDEPRRHDLTRRVDHVAPIEIDPDLGDAAVGDRHLGSPSGLAGAIHERAAFDDQICAHAALPWRKSIVRAYLYVPGSAPNSRSAVANAVRRRRASVSSRYNVWP